MIEEFPKALRWLTCMKHSRRMNSTQMVVFASYEAEGIGDPWDGICNELKVEAYRRIDDHDINLQRLIEGNGVESSDFRLVPWSFTITIDMGALKSC